MFLSNRSVSNPPIASILLKAKRFGILSILALTTTLVSQPLSANAQISVDGSTATEVKGNIISPTGQGTVNGGNLYNSFDRFNVPTSGVIFNTGTSSVDGAKVNNIINRVTGDTASNILGTIESRQAFPNANLYLLNPNGVVFGVNARLDIGGSFHATTGTGLGFDQNQKFNVDKNSPNFPSGDPKNIQFGISQPAAIINQGNLTVDTGKNISLTAGTVINTGNLTAPAGNVNLAAVSGNSQVELRSPDLVLGFAVNKNVVPSTWNGEIATLPKLAESLTGKASQANQVVVKADGTISLVASPSPSDIVVKDGMAIASGNINVSFDIAKGGNVGIFGNQVGLVNSQINASGATGGGNVLIGGAFQGKGITPNALQTYVDQSSKILANGLLTGNGGKVIIWADRSTQFFGAIAAKGGQTAGNGGFVEVSGKENLDYRGFTNTLATFGNIGTLLLDPTSITVVNTGGSASLTNSRLAFADNPAIATLDSAVISNATSNVILQAATDINFSDAITIAANGVGLTAQAGNSINVNSPIRTTGGSVKLIANDNTFGSATGTGNITVFAAIDTTNIGAATGGAIDLQISNGGQISVNAPLRSGAGNITLNTNGSSIANARGINIGSGSNISSTSGTITLNGNVSGANARGINIGSGSTITSTSGVISLTGISTGAAGDDGIQIEPISFGNTTTIKTNGNIAITGNASNPSRLGVNIQPNVNGTLTIDSGSGNLTVTSDKSAFPTVNLKGSGTITLQPYSPNVPLVINGSTTNFSGGTTNVNVFADSSFLNTLVASPNFSNIVIGNATTNNAITVASPLTINANSAPIAILGDTITVNGAISSASANSLTLDATNNIAINNILDVTGSGSFTAKAINNINVNGSQLTTRAGALTLTATNGDINIPSTTTTTSLGSFTTGDITFTAGNGIVLGGTVLSTSGGFIKLIAGNGGINDTAINGINSTAPSGNSGDITIDTTGSVAITNGVISSSTVGNAGNITINALNGNTAVGNLLANTSSTTANAGSLAIKALNITSIGNIDLSAVSGKAGDITLSGNLPLTASTTFSTNSGGLSGNINLGNAAVTGNQSLTLNAGTGNVTLGAIGTNATPLTDITVSGGNTTLNKDIYTSNFLTFNSPVNLGDNVSLSSTVGNITFNSTVDGNKILSLNARGNFIFFNSPVGGVTPLASLSINPASTLARTGNLTGSLNVTTSDNINTGAIRTFGNSVFLTSNQGTINTSSITTNGFSSISQSGNVTLKANGNLTTRDINANGFPPETGGFIGSGGNVSLTSQTGKISTGNVNTSGLIGGQVFFNALTEINAGNINSSGLSQAGNVTLDPLGDVVVSSIDTSSSLGTGGNVKLVSTSGNLRITDSILSSIISSCVGASICTTGETSGNIDLQTGGLNPFAVGDASINGSNGIITTGRSTLSLGTNIPVVFGNSFTQGGISITPGGILTTRDTFQPSQKTDVLGTTDVDDKKLLALRDILKKEVDRYLITGNLEKAFDVLERTYIAELEIFTGNPLDFTGLTLEKTQDLLSTVAQQSGDVAALIYPVLLDNRIEILVVPPKEKGKPFRKFTNAANQEMIEALVSDYRNNIRDVGSNDYLEQSQKLYDLIIRPIDQQLVAMKINTLVFVMDGGLRVTPPAALHDGKQFLIERYAIANVPTIRATRVEERDRKATRILAMGLTESIEGFSALPSVDIEIKTISSEVLKGTAFLNKDFTVSNLQNERQKGIYSILHLGTHAKFVSDTSQESFIQFWDSRLRLSEIPKLRFDSPAIDMLTLSACQTAVGNNLGISGLAVESGARSVLASLWEVSDSGTAPLMISFYKAFPEAVNKAQAMQQAQIQLLTGKVNIRNNQITGITGFPNIPLPTGSGDINLSHPFYWSSFILVGNWL